MKNKFYFLDTVTVRACGQMDNDTIRNLWRGFCLGQGNLTVQPMEGFCFVMGQPELPVLSPDCEFAIRVEESGAAVVGRDYGGLVRGYLCLLMKIEYQGERLCFPTLEMQSHYRIQNRMIHICIFPENDLLFIKKLIRLAALCQYTHVVMEFWGMLRYDCLKELAWPHAFTKEQAATLIRECRELGMEPIPMFNQLGHATASRVCYGKHVVLDQNPRLQHLFTPDGWAWNIESEAVDNLLKAVRGELYDLFGPGSYLHIGCDEAYFISQNQQLRQHLPEYLAKLTAEVEAEGRRPMMWMDMLLEKNQFPHCYSVGEPEECQKLRQATAKSTVFVDWQYDCTDTPVPSLLSLKNSGRDAMGAPWFQARNYQAHIETVSANQMHGVMLTTWHLLQDHMPCILGCAQACGAETFSWSQFSGLREETATMLRRVSFEGNSYEDSGWSKAQIEV